MLEGKCEFDYEQFKQDIEELGDSVATVFADDNKKYLSTDLNKDINEEKTFISNQIKLIDYGISTIVSNTGNISNNFGNLAFSAPESFTGEKLTIHSDIYSLGKLLEFIGEFVYPTLSQNIMHIIHKSIETDPVNRYETVDELLLAIAKEKHYSRQEHSCKTIAVIGSSPGCGTTHISIALVSVLNYLGYPACFYETAQKSNLHSLKTALPRTKETDGCLHYKYFYGYPNYGSGIILPKDSSKIKVLDFGSTYKRNNKELLEADLILFVCSSGVWNWQNVIDKGETLLNTHGNLAFICNLGTHKPLHVYAQKFHKPIYSFPFDSNPFRITKDKCRLFTHLLQSKRRNRLFFHLKQFLARKKP